MKRDFFSSSPIQTKRLGKKIAREVLRRKLQKTAFVLGLRGELGSGKTTFLQGFAKGLGIREKILSPTFVIIKKFQVPSSKFQVFYHIDCYRIKKPKELFVLGFREIISNPQNIVAIEWAEKVKKLLPKTTLWLKFDFIDEKTRRIIIKNFQV